MSVPVQLDEAAKSAWEAMRPHFFWVVVLGVGLGFSHAWLREHDERVLAEQTVKQSESQVKLLQAQNSQLQAQVRDTDAATQRAITSLKAAAARVVTPTQAVAAIPDVSALPLKTVALPDGRVSVDALNLYQELNTCKQNEVELGQCKTARALEDQIIANNNKAIEGKDAEIKALQKKPSFFKRIKTGAELIGIGIGIGALAALHGF